MKNASSTNTAKGPPERGNQRYCCHQFTGGACVMCHYNPWRELGAAFDAVSARKEEHERRKP